MEFKVYGRAKEKITHTLHPQKFLREHILKRLNFLFAFLNDTNDEFFDTFLENYTRHLKSEIQLAHFSDRELEITFMLTHFPYLQPFPGLIKQHMNLFIQLLGITESQFWNNAVMVTTIEAWGNAIFRFEVHQVKALIDTVGKQEALAVFREYRDQYTIETADDIPAFNTLEELRQSLIHLAESDWMGRVRTIGTVEDGRFVHRCDNCEKVEHLDWADVKDPDILEALFCYKQFQVTILYNVNFTLTRERNLVRGDTFCDETYHDNRLVKEIVHPGETFWQEIDQQIVIQPVER